MRTGLLITVLLLVGLPGFGQEAGLELLSNPSMELDEDGDGWPDGWRTSADVEYKAATKLGEHPYIIERSDDAHTGAHSLHYQAAVVPRPELTAENWWNLPAWIEARKFMRTWAIPIVSPRFAVEGETEYLMTMWIKATGARILHLKFIGHYTGHPETKTYWTQPLLRSPAGETHMDGSWDWTEFKTKLFVPGGQEWGRLEVWVWQDGQPCELWVDDMSVRLTNPGGDAQ